MVKTTSFGRELSPLPVSFTIAPVQRTYISISELIYMLSISLAYSRSSRLLRRLGVEVGQQQQQLECAKEFWRFLTSQKSDGKDRTYIYEYLSLSLFHSILSFSFCLISLSLGSNFFSTLLQLKTQKKNPKTNLIFHPSSFSSSCSSFPPSFMQGHNSHYLATYVYLFQEEKYDSVLENTWHLEHMSL